MRALARFLFSAWSLALVTAQDATLTPAAIVDAFTLTLTASGFPSDNSEQLAGVVAFSTGGLIGKIMLDGLPSGNIYLIADVDGQMAPTGQTFQPVSQVAGGGAQAMVLIGQTIYLADAANFQILQLTLDGQVMPPLVDHLPTRPTALCLNARTGHLIVSGGGMVLDVDPQAPNPYTVLIPDWGTGGVAFSEDYSTLFVEGGTWGSPTIRRYIVSGQTATRDLSHSDVQSMEQLFGLVVGTGCLSPALFMSSASGFVRVLTPTTVQVLVQSNFAGFFARDEKDGCLLFTGQSLWRICPPECGGFVGITPAPVNPCNTNNGGCGANQDCAPTITGAPQCTCTTGYVSGAGGSCVAVNLAGVWEATNNAGVFITVVQNGLQLTVTSTAEPPAWTSGVGTIGSGGSLTFEFNDAPGVIGSAQTDAQQTSIVFSNPAGDTTWLKRTAVGGACNVNTDCTSGNCDMGTCKQSSVDVSCASDADCSSNNCGPANTCQPNGDGGKCGSQSDCAANLLCKDRKCGGVNACYTYNGGCSSDAVCVPTGSNKRKCHCNQGYSGAGIGAKGCRGPCLGNPAAKHGGGISCTDVLVPDNTVCDLVCPDGFFSRGSFKCDDGHWKERDPLCSAATCSPPDLSMVAHATYGDCKGKRTYHTCNLGCEAGFLPQGNTQAVCLGTDVDQAQYEFGMFTCQDIDECSYVPHMCGEGWHCSNTVGDYKCVPLAPALGFKTKSEIGLRWTRLGDKQKIQSLHVQVTYPDSHIKMHKVDDPERADSARISGLVQGSTYHFALVAETKRGVQTGMSLSVTL